VASVVRPFALHAAIDAMFSYQPREALRDMPTPLLVAVAESGTADDEEGRERIAALDDVIRARVARGQTDTTVRRFPGAGHNLMRYRSDELAAALLELLQAAAHQRP
jgi:hypothetical protein